MRSTDAVEHLASPRIINLVMDPQEREPISLPYLHSWTATHFILAEYRESVQREPLIPAGAPLEHTPNTPATGSVTAPVD